MTTGNVRPGDKPRAALTILAMLSAAVLLAPVIAPHDPNAQLDIVALKNAPPSSSNVLGTDPFSRDTLSRLLYGGRTSLMVAFVATVVAAGFGALWGVISGWKHGHVTRVMRVAFDVYRSIPRILLLLAVFSIAGHVSPGALAIIVGLVLWPVAAAIAHSETERVRASEFAVAAVATGSTFMSMLRHHIAPHIAPPLLAASVLLFADVIAFEAGLSFIGLGVRAPQASWGGMLQDALPYLASAWWVAVIPCASLVVTVLAISSVGQWIDRRHSLETHIAGSNS